MESKKSVSLLLAVIFLVGIGMVVATGFLKNKQGEAKKTENQSVLGETAEPSVTPTPLLDINRFVADTFQSTKEVAQQKATEVQKVVLTTVEKEISSLTQSQVDALKLQICRDWGIAVAPSPTKTP